MYCHNFFEKYKSMIMYVVSGALSTLVNWVTYASCTNILPITSSHELILASNIIAWTVTLVFSYIFYKNWVFESQTNSIQELFLEMLSFTGARLFTGFIEIFGVPFLVGLGIDRTIYGVEGFVAKIWVTIVVTILNYFFSKNFVFKNHSQSLSHSTILRVFSR